MERVEGEELKENDRFALDFDSSFPSGEVVMISGVVNARRLLPGPLCGETGMEDRTVIEGVDGSVTGVDRGVGNNDLDLVCTGVLGRERNGLECDGEDVEEAGVEDDEEKISFMRRFFIAMRIRILALKFELGLELGLRFSFLFVGVVIRDDIILIDGTGSIFSEPSSPCSRNNVAWRSLVPLPALLRSTPQRARNRARHTVLSRARVRHVRETLQHARSVASAVWADSCSWGIWRWEEAME